MTPPPRTWVEVVREAYPAPHDFPTRFVPGEAGDTLYDFVVLETQDVAGDALVTDPQAGDAVLHALWKAVEDLATVIQAVRKARQP